MDEVAEIGSDTEPKVIVVDVEPGWYGKFKRRCSGWYGRFKRRSWVVEPLFLIYLVAGFPMMSITSQYMFYKAAENLNLTIIDGNSSSNDPCSGVHNSSAYHDRQLIEVEAAKWGMYKSMAEFVPSIFAMIFYGYIGDTFGRKFLLAFPCIGSIVSISVYLTVMQFDLPIYWILLSGLESVFGGFSLMIVGCMSYIADTVPKEKRGYRMTLVDVIGIINGAIAGLFIGYWIKAQGFEYPLFFVLGGKILALLYVIFLIPETLNRDDSNRSSSGQSKLKQILKGIMLLIKDNGSKRLWKLWFLILVYILPDLISTRGISTLFLMNSPRCWDSVRIGYYSSISMILHGIGTLIFAKLPPKFMNNSLKVVVSRLSSSLHYVLLAFAYSEILIYIAPIAGILTFLAIPMLRLHLSELVEANEQACIFSMMTTMGLIINMISSVTSSKLYQISLPFFDGLVYLIAACLLLLSGLLMLIYWKLTSNPNEYKRMSENEVEGNIQ